MWCEDAWISFENNFVIFVWCCIQATGVLLLPGLCESALCHTDLLNQLVLVKIWKTLSYNLQYVLNNPLLCCPCSLCLFEYTNYFSLIICPVTIQNRRGSSLHNISCPNDRDSNSDIKQRL